MVIKLLSYYPAAARMATRDALPIHVAARLGSSEVVVADLPPLEHNKEG